MNRLKQTALRLLREGLRPDHIAVAVSVGWVLGIFPILGPWVIVCTAVALLTRLNLPILLAAYYSMSLVQPLLIIPFLRMGERIFAAEPLPISLVELSRRFSTDAAGTFAEFGWSFVHALAGWLVLAPFLTALLYLAARARMARWKPSPTEAR
jgi:uncharacterized protein (DUF2062 family)